MSIFAAFIGLVVFAILFHYIFHIYEIDYKISTNFLYADYNSEVTIEVIPVNSWGFKAPFREARAKFEIEEGSNLVDIVLSDSVKGKLVLRAKDIKGNVSIKIKSEYSLFPGLIEIKVIPNAA